MFFTMAFNSCDKIFLKAILGKMFGGEQSYQDWFVGFFKILMVALMSVQSPHGVCRVMLQGVVNTGIVQASDKGSRGSNSNF